MSLENYLVRSNAAEIEIRSTFRPEDPGQLYNILKEKGYRWYLEFLAANLQDILKYISLPRSRRLAKKMDESSRWTRFSLCRIANILDNTEISVRYSWHRHDSWPRILPRLSLSDCRCSRTVDSISAIENVPVWWLWFSFFITIVVDLFGFRYLLSVPPRCRGFGRPFHTRGMLPGRIRSAVAIQKSLPFPLSRREPWLNSV